MRAPPSRTVPASGASWPLTRLKQVVLPAPLGPISATSSPASTANDTSRTASHAVEDLAAETVDAQRPASRARHRCACSRASAPPMPIGNASTITRIARAEHRVPVLGDARERVGEPGERRRAEQRSGERVETAQQHHDERVDRARNRERLRRDAALRERVQAAGEAGERAGERERRATACRGTSMPIACGAQRRVAARAQRVAERRLRDPGERGERRARRGRARTSSRRGRARASPAARCRRGRSSRRSRCPTGTRSTTRSARTRASASRGRRPTAARRTSRRRARRRARRAARRASAAGIGQPCFARERGGVGADAEVGGVAERRHAAGAHQELQARREQREHEDVGREHQRYSSPRERQQRRQREQRPARRSRRGGPARTTSARNSASGVVGGAGGRLAEQTVRLARPARSPSRRIRRPA